MQKQQYLRGFLQKNMQKQQRFKGILQHACKNSDIYQVFCNKRSKAAIFIRFSATHMQKQGLPYLWSGAVAEMSKSRALVTSG